MILKSLAHLPVVVALLCGGAASPQTQATQQDQIPDAPTPNKTAPSFPTNTAPAPRSGDRPLPPATEEPLPPPSNELPKPMPASTRSANSDSDSRDEFTIRRTVNFVPVPVTVKDSNGRLVFGLLKRDFSILENGEPQQISFFTSDPFPLSVSVVVDVNLPEQTMRKVKETLPALTGAFSDFDEVGVFSYGNTVSQRMDFAGAGGQLAVVLQRPEFQGRNDGPPVLSGPMTGGPTPSVNGRPFEPGTPHVANIRRDSSVLNDAILAAATALSKRPVNRRKIIFVISDGMEQGSRASYSDVLKVLLSHEIGVYAIAVDAGAIPGYDTLNKIHIPRFGYGNILGKYVAGTGGEVFAEFNKDSIEQAYSRVTEEARNQYTLGYTTRATASNTYRSIEVLVHRGPDLEVHAKAGYYPLPPQR